MTLPIESVAAAYDRLVATVDRDAVRSVLNRGRQSVANALGAGPVHRRRLASVDTRIVVSGVRGKSSAVRWLHDAFDSRDREVLAKVTGNHPHLLRNGVSEPIERGTQVRLYENERLLRTAATDDLDVLVFENQGIRQYTTRLINEQFVRPDIVFLTNAREDHLDTLGSNRTQIARALARSITAGTLVVCGESDEGLRNYIADELDRRDATVEFVDPPADVQSTPGAEIVYGVDTILQAVCGEGLTDRQIEGYLDTLRPEWIDLPSGRVFNAASVNDVQSTELTRSYLVGESNEQVEPLLNLRRDRRGRTASFIRYLDSLYDSGKIEQVHLTGADQQLFALNTDVPVCRHDTDEESAADVLTDAVDTGRPVLLMGNTVTDFMRSMADEIRRRTDDDETPESAETSDTEASPKGTDAEAPLPAVVGRGGESDVKRLEPIDVEELDETDAETDVETVIDPDAETLVEPSVETVVESDGEVPSASDGEVPSAPDGEVSNDQETETGETDVATAVTETTETAPEPGETDAETADTDRGDGEDG